MYAEFLDEKARSRKVKQKATDIVNFLCTDPRL